MIKGGVLWLEEACSSYGPRILTFSSITHALIDHMHTENLFFLISLLVDEIVYMDYIMLMETQDGGRISYLERNL